MRSYQHKQLISFLTNLEWFHTLPCSITTFEYKLSSTLHLPYSPTYPSLSTLPPPTHQLLIQAIQNQNLLGWDTALKGYTSQLWWDLQNSHLGSLPVCLNWDVRLVSTITSLYKQFWDDRNKFLHGSTWLESKPKLHDQVLDEVKLRVLDEVKLIYASPQKLHPRFPKITKIPLDSQLNHRTVSLQQWLARIKYQKQVSDSLFLLSRESQLML